MAFFLVSLVALFFLVMGLWAIFLPDSLADLVGFSLDVDRGPNEIRAVYGGFGIAMAGMAWWAVLSSPAATGMLVALGIALIGMAAGRVISLALEGRLPTFGLLAGTGELALACALFWSVALLGA